MNGTFFARCRRAACGKRDFFHELNFFTKTFKLFYWSEALKSHFEVAYLVYKTRLSALRARGAREAGFFFMNQFFLSRRLTYFNGPSV